MKKNARNNYGVKGATTPGIEFFNDLNRPVNPVVVAHAKSIFDGIAAVRVVCID